jgi:hypothetical protein
MPSQIRVINYANSTGLIERDWDRRNPPRIVGYCNESIDSVFKSLFPTFFVTRFNGFEIFPSNPRDFFPQVGLEISAYRSTQPVYGLNNEVIGDLPGLRKVLERDPQATQFTRDSSKFQEEVEFLLALQARSQDSSNFLYGKPEGQVEIDRLEKMKSLVRKFKR